MVATARIEDGKSSQLTPNPYGSCLDGPCAPYAGTTRLPINFNANPNRGVFLYLNQGVHVTFNVRVQDITRQADTWGTSIPVVREKDVFTGKLQLLDIPIDSHFRDALRIYDFDSYGPDSSSVRVRIYDMCGVGPLDRDCQMTPLVDTAVTLQVIHASTIPSEPASWMYPDLLAAFPQLGNVPPAMYDPIAVPRVRIDIDPITPGLRFWAFVSVTNNATQHVTVIAPN